MAKAKFCGEIARYEDTSNNAMKSLEITLIGFINLTMNFWK